MAPIYVETKKTNLKNYFSSSNQKFHRGIGSSDFINTMLLPAKEYDVHKREWALIIALQEVQAAW